MMPLAEKIMTQKFVLLIFLVVGQKTVYTQSSITFNAICPRTCRARLILATSLGTSTCHKVTNIVKSYWCWKASGCWSQLLLDACTNKVTGYNAPNEVKLAAVRRHCSIHQPRVAHSCIETMRELWPIPLLWPDANAVTRDILIKKINTAHVLVVLSDHVWLRYWDFNTFASSVYRTHRLHCIKVGGDCNNCIVVPLHNHHFLAFVKVSKIDTYA